MLFLLFVFQPEGIACCIPRHERLRARCGAGGDVPGGDPALSGCCHLESGRTFQKGAVGELGPLPHSSSRGELRGHKHRGKGETLGLFFGFEGDFLLITASCSRGRVGKQQPPRVGRDS